MSFVQSYSVSFGKVSPDALNNRESTGFDARVFAPPEAGNCSRMPSGYVLTIRRGFPSRQQNNRLVLLGLAKRTGYVYESLTTRNTAHTGECGNYDRTITGKNRGGWITVEAGYRGASSADPVKAKAEGAAWAAKAIRLVYHTHPKGLAGDGRQHAERNPLRNRVKAPVCQEACLSESESESESYRSPRFRRDSASKGTPL